MSFWSSQKIKVNLARLTNHVDDDMIDCNALTLRIGGEVFVTPGLDQASPELQTKKQLMPSESFSIPPGRFAFLLTEEEISVPSDVMGFISIKATYKMKGLVNVSGFHVDPGWRGPLVFTVFNAGTAPIHLQRGLPVFLLWIADLDEKSAKHKTKPGDPGISPSYINNISGVTDSIYAVERRLKQDLKDVNKRQDEFRDQVAALKENQHKVLTYLTIGAIVATSVLTLLLKIAADRLFPPPGRVSAASAEPSNRSGPKSAEASQAPVINPLLEISRPRQPRVNYQLSPTSSPQISSLAKASITKAASAAAPDTPSQVR